MIHSNEPSMRNSGPNDPRANERHGGETLASPVQLIHHLLRGRYLWAFLLCSILGGALGYGGYKMAKVTYRSRGEIRIIPVLPSVSPGAVDDKNILSYFESFVQAQAQLLQSERVRDEAMQDLEWDSLRRGNSDEKVLEFMKSIKILTEKSGFIYVDFVDTDRVAARYGCKALMVAFKKIYSEGEGHRGDTAINLLDGAVSKLRADLDSATAKVREYQIYHGTDDVESSWQYERNKLSENLGMLEQYRRILTAMTIQNPNQAGGAKEVTEDDISRTDPTMAELVRQRSKIKLEILSMQSRGILSKSPVMVNAVKELDAVEGQITDRRLEYANSPLKSQGKSGMTAEFLTQQVKDYENKVEDSRKKVRDLFGQIQLLNGAREVAAQIRQNWEEKANQLANRQLESKISGRVTVSEDVTHPLDANSDDRIRFASIGGVLGTLIGLALVMMVGYSDSRLRYADDAISRFHLVPLIGILPELPNNTNDPEQAALVSHCVHQIRGLLQIQGGVKGQSVFCVTSPVAGTGKTTLTHALGVSFAHTNSRTLLIDCDMVGKGLSSRVGVMVHRKLGRILRKMGVLSPEKLSQGLKLARAANKRIGEMLIELGYVSLEDVDRALMAQESEPIGLLDVIQGDDLNECIGETTVPGLAILPLGMANSEHVSQLSPTAMRNIIDQAKRTFDIILIDTGPIPGSLEASVVASHTDGVILAVSRGEQRPLAEQCFNHLSAIGARVVGFVFNRARNKDVYASGTKYMSGGAAFGSRRLPGSSRRSRSQQRPGDVSPSAVVSAVSTRVPNAGPGSASRRIPGGSSPGTLSGNRGNNGNATLVTSSTVVDPAADSVPAKPTEANGQNGATNPKKS